MLIQARRQENAAVDAVHPLRKGEVEIGGLVVAIVTNRLGRPRDATFRAKFHHVGWQAVLCNHRTTRFDETMVAGNHIVGGLGRAHFSQHRTCSRHAQRVAVIGAEVHDTTVGDFVHVFALATKGAERQAAADRLGKRDEVRFDAESASGTSPPSGDAGLHFVEHQQRAVLAGDFAHRLQISRLRQTDADVLHDGLDDERRNLATA